MGLDICFDHDAAIKAGGVVSTDWHEIRDEDGYGEVIERYKLQYFHHPYRDIASSCWWDEGDVTIAVRANKWGDAYEPLTRWLKDNNIEWSEF